MGFEVRDAAFEGRCPGSRQEDVKKLANFQARGFMLNVASPKL